MVKVFIIFLDTTEAPTTAAPPAAETTPGGMRMSIIHIATSLILTECKSVSYANTIFTF